MARLHDLCENISAKSLAVSRKVRMFAVQIKPITGLHPHTKNVLRRRPLPSCSPVMRVWSANLGGDASFRTYYSTLSMELQTRTESAPTRKHSTGCAQTTPSVFGRLTKAELITLLEGRALRPLTDAEFTRGAVSLVLAWCGRAVRGEYASLVDLTGDLQSLLKIYQSYKS